MKKFGFSIVVVAVIWAAVLVSVGMVLNGPEKTQIITLVGGGAFAALLVLAGLYHRLART